jgi:hypothetical protein
MDMPKFLREMCLRLQGEEELGQILPRMLCDVSKLMKNYHTVDQMF